MRVLEWLGRRRKDRPSRVGETVAFEITQNGNSVSVEADGIDVYFGVEGIGLPSESDASFAVWALLPMAMEEGFNLHINRPIDPQVAANAKHLSQIWEMWVPSRYRSISISGQGEWPRPPRVRIPQVELFSGGINSTFSILRNRKSQNRGVVATVCGIDKTTDTNLAALAAKTEPILKQLNCTRIFIRTNAKRKPSSLTHGLTLAGCLFLLSDLFEQGTIAANSTRAMDLAEWPWGNNHVTNEYFAGTDFAVRTVGLEVGRTEKIASIIRAGIDLRALSFCRKNVIPSNCGTCPKCVRTKAMLLITTGRIPPDIFIDNSLDERLLRRMIHPRTELFDLYCYAKEHGSLGRIPSLVSLVEECRAS